MMASKETENIKPTITKHSSEFQKDVYASTPIGELVLFALAVLQAEASPVPVEEIVSTCFRLFPNSFSLKNYFYWPDSALVARHLQNAKEKGLLKGSSADGYELKGSGKQSAKQTAKALNVSLPTSPKPVVGAVVVKIEPPAAVEAKVVVAEEKKAPAQPAKKPAVKKPVEKLPVKKEAVKPIKPKAQKQSPKAAPPAKKKTAPKPKAEEKKQTAKPAVKAKTAEKAKPAPKEKPVAKKPAEQPKPAPKAKADVKPVELAKAKPTLKAKVKAKPAAKPVVKPKAKPATKAKPKAKPVVKPVEAPKAKPVVKPQEKPAPKPKTQKVKAEAPKQLSLELTPLPVKEKAKAPATQPKTKKEPPPVVEKKPVKVETSAPAAVSKEEKVKAAKVIKQVERSDAYQLYRRNGKRAQISEFDFRNMLFATMESSAETLKRNLDLFKRYAGIHFRTDLIAFLEFCEENFAALVTVKVKGKK